MMSTLKYGQHGSLRFDEEHGTEFIECDAAPAPLPDVAAAVEEALTHPLRFPALRQAVLPTDKVVVALEEHVPRGLEVARAVFEQLASWGVPAENLTLLVARPLNGSAGSSLLKGSAVSSLPAEVCVVVHDPSKRDQMAYLAAMPSGDPLYLNRALCDADVVIPIASVRMGTRGAKTSDGLYPVFSSSPSPSASGKRDRRKPPTPAEAAERPDVCWLLGVPCLLQVVPGPGDSALAVLAGEPAAVRLESRRRCEAAWRFSVPRSASLVVAAIEGDDSQQTWEHVARALAAAERVVEEEGAIAICCELRHEPGPAVQALTETDDRDGALRAIRRAQLPDAQVAARLVKACNKATVYLLSHLDQDLVEELGMAPIAEAAEVARLAQHHDSCLLLANAQHAVAIPQE